MKVSLRFVAIASLSTAMTTATAILPTNPPTLAQDESCYMITATGQRVSLGKLCAGGAAQTKASTKGYFQAPIKRRSGGTPVIDVVFNGQQTFEMLVDTGASGTLITRSMAQALAIPLVGAGRYTMADGRAVVMPIGRISSMTVDGATVNNLNVAIAGDSADGLLGHDFLGNYDITIKQNVVEFHPR